MGTLNHAAGPADEKLKQSKLSAGQAQWLAGDECLTGRRIEGKAPHLDGRIGRNGVRPPTGRAQPREKLTYREWLYEIVDRPGIQSFDAVGNVVSRGEEDYGSGAGPGFGDWNERDAVAVGEPPVEQDRPERLLDDRLERIGKRGDMIDRPAFPLEAANQLLGKLGIVLNEENA